MDFGRPARRPKALKKFARRVGTYVDVVRGEFVKLLIGVDPNNGTVVPDVGRKAEMLARRNLVAAERLFGQCEAIRGSCSATLSIHRSPGIVLCPHIVLCFALQLHSAFKPRHASTLVPVYASSTSRAIAVISGAIHLPESRGVFPSSTEPALQHGEDLRSYPVPLSEAERA